MAVSRPYHEQIDIRNTKKLRELEGTLPQFLFYFFRGIEPNTSSRTRIAYAYDLRVFFDYLTENHPFFRGKDVRSLEVSSLENVKPIDLEAYMDYLKYLLSKALALSSALLVGFYGGEAIMCAMRSSNEYYSGQILSCLTVAIVCIVDMFAGILGEKWCQLPSDDIKDEKSSDRAGNASNASNAAESSVEKNKA